MLTCADPIDAMRRQALRMTAIVHDLLELSRLEAEEGAPTGEPVDVGGLLARLRSDLLARLSEARDVQIVIDSSERLLGVEAQLHSAFGNLLGKCRQIHGGGRDDCDALVG